MNRTLARVCLLLAIVPGFALPALAGNGGSMYSMLGIGDIRLSSGARSAGMGYAGTAVASVSSLNMLAPATWSRLTRTRLETGALYEGFASSDAAASRYLAHLAFNGVAVGFPISPERGITLAAGFLPYSNVDFNTYTRGTARSSSDSLAYTFHHIGSGGLAVGKLGLSWMPFAALSAGATFDYYFGTVDYVGTLVPGTSTIGGAQFNRSTSYRGAGVTLGVLLTGAGTGIDGLGSFALGASVSSRAALASSQQTVLGYGTDPASFTSELDTTAERTGRMVIPLTYSVGVSYAAGERILLAADYRAQLWQKAAMEGVVPGSLRNSARIGVGIERLPSRETNALWGQRLALRLGAVYHATYFRPFGTAINEWLVTGGVSLPVSGESRITLAAEYGARGTTGPGLVRDRIFRLTASITIGELWFVRAEEE